MSIASEYNRSEDGRIYDVDRHNLKLNFWHISRSDGGGRSGVYLAIDANMELAEEEDCFHVFGYLKKLRQSRKGLIENVVSAHCSVCVNTPSVSRKIDEINLT